MGNFWGVFCPFLSVQNFPTKNKVSQKIINFKKVCMWHETHWWRVKILSKFKHSSSWEVWCFKDLKKRVTYLMNQSVSYEGVCRTTGLIIILIIVIYHIFYVHWAVSFPGSVCLPRPLPGTHKALPFTVQTSSPFHRVWVMFLFINIKQNLSVCICIYPFFFNMNYFVFVFF